MSAGMPKCVRAEKVKKSRVNAIFHVISGKLQQILIARLDPAESAAAERYLQSDRDTASLLGKLMLNYTSNE